MTWRTGPFSKRKDASSVRPSLNWIVAHCRVFGRSVSRTANNMRELRGCKRFCIVRLIKLLQLLDLLTFAFSRVEDHLTQFANQITIPARDFCLTWFR